jgi:hypothetical protein
MQGFIAKRSLMRRLLVGLGPLVLALALVLLALNACGSTQVSHGGPVRDYVSLVDHLRAAGVTVVPETAENTPTVPTGETSSSYMSVAGLVISVNGARVTVYEYADEAAANAEAARISPDGGTFQPSRGVSGASVDWIAPPHFYKAGRILVLYVGTDTAITTLLTHQVGPQFAGRRERILESQEVT